MKTIIPEDVAPTPGGALADKSSSQGTDHWLQEHLDVIKTAILKDAQEIAEKHNRKRPEPIDVSRAAERWAPARVFSEEVSLWARIKESISGITLLAGILALAFGILGMWISASSGTTASANAQGFLDIAKILAGAVVGSAGTGAAGQRS